MLTNLISRERTPATMLSYGGKQIVLADFNYQNLKLGVFYMFSKREFSQSATLAAITAACTLLIAPDLATAESASTIRPSITTPDRVESRIGALDFKDGMPSSDTLAKVYDNLDCKHAFDAFVNTMQGVNFRAVHKGLLEAGVKDNEVLIFSELMDSKSLFLTANADTVYAFGILDLSNGPMVLEIPPGFLGGIDDYWFGWVTDIGGPGPDRGLGGKYLIVPPGYDGLLPEGGFFIARAQTSRVLWFGRMFLENKSDPKPGVDLIRKFTNIYPYQPGGVGTSFAEFLSGKAPLGPVTTPPEPVFHEGSGRAINTIPPNDFSYYEMLNEVVQEEPSTSLDSELMGSLAAIGIVKGKPFAPDARMKRMLTEALAVANATSRSLFMNPRDPTWYYYPGSAWLNPMLIGGHAFDTPGYRTLDNRAWYFYGLVGVSPAMAMRLTGVGSQYLYATVDANKQYFDGSKTYKVTLPVGIPAANFWSLTVYDNQSRSMLDTPQRYPRAGSQSHPSPAAKPNADGSTTVYFAPAQPEGVVRGNWIQTIRGKGWFVMLRLYGPLEPYFDKSWRISEVELMR